MVPDFVRLGFTAEIPLAQPVAFRPGFYESRSDQLRRTPPRCERHSPVWEQLRQATFLSANPSGPFGADTASQQKFTANL